MAVHETREIGKAEPGFDVAATIKMVRKPLDQTIALAAATAEFDVTGPIPSDRLYVDLRSDELGVSVLMDRRWRMMNDVPGAAMMRMIENDRSIAQCDFRPLVGPQPGAQWTLEAFQADVKQTLGEQLSDLIEADQRVSEAGLRVLRVTAQGSVEGVPIQWIVLHFSDDSGRRVLGHLYDGGQTRRGLRRIGHAIGQHTEIHRIADDRKPQRLPARHRRKRRPACRRRQIPAKIQSGKYNQRVTCGELWKRAPDETLVSEKKRTV